MHTPRLLSLLTLVTAASGCGPLPDDPAPTQTEVQLPGPAFYPEGIAVSDDGTFYAGSLGTGAIALAKPGVLGADIFVPGRPMFGVYGLEVDEAHGTLWACTYDDTLPPAQPAHLAAYDLATGQQKASHPMPGGSGFCNDVTVDPAGNVYATDSLANTIVRLPLGGSALTTWAENAAFAPDVEGDYTLNGIIHDGANGLYVVKSDTGTLFSIPINPDGTAGAPVVIPVEPALITPDGLERVDAQTLLVVENSAGQASTVTLSGGTGTKAVIANGFTEPTAAAIRGDSAWVLESQMGYLFGVPGTPTLPFRVHRVVLP